MGDEYSSPLLPSLHGLELLELLGLELLELLDVAISTAASTYVARRCSCPGSPCPSSMRRSPTAAALVASLDS